MRIGIDLHTVTGMSQGTRTYTLNITKNLLKIDKSNEYVLYFTKKNEELQNFFHQSNVTFRDIFPRERITRILLGFPLRLMADDIDIFHCQYMGPPLTNTPYIVMLHDVIHEYHPEFYPKALCLMMRMFYPFSARRASRILTVSEHSKNDIMKYYKIPAHKIVVTYDGVSEDFSPIHDKRMIQNALRKYNINSEYILYVGRLEPRKNIPRLIQAFHALKTDTDLKQKLVITGMKYFQSEKLAEAVNDLGLQDEVIFTGRVDDIDLPLLYNGASLFVYPSIAEGFGIPPLEAMSCGVPVISSDASSLPEVIGDAGILINPYNISDISEAMYQVLTDRNLQQKMGRKGVAQAKKFSWEDSAKKTLRVYEEVYSEKNAKTK